tara:strand:- start:2050 stop:2880 length:831 start_codon:yes stop_codon:yes gene_type:complete
MGCFISNPSVLENYAGESLVYQPTISNEVTSIYVSSCTGDTLWKVCKGEPEVIRQKFMNNYRVKRLSISPMIVGPQQMFKISNNEIAISMNHYPGDLFSFTTTTFDLNRVFKGLQDIANAIDFLHSRGLAHRDIKPENIVVDKDYFRLIDFDFTSPVANFVYCGTTDYMYPGQNTWSAQDSSRRYDIYAFGRTILYVFYCAASLKMIDYMSFMKKIYLKNAILKDVQNPWKATTINGYWFDVALKCLKEIPHLSTVPTTNDTITSLEVVYTDDIVA